ncbi:MAG: cation diffusion facilitator family transporter [Bacteroidales bacterium]
MVKNKVINIRKKRIQQTSIIGIIGNGLLAILKITVGIIAKSTAVIADGIDSASDIIGSIVTYYASNVSDLPPDMGHPWGHKRIETIASKVIAIFILFAGIQLIIITVSGLISGNEKEMPGIAAIIVTVISMIAKAIIAAYKFRIAKKFDSEMVRADAINMRNDIFLSTTVLIGLGLTFLVKLPIIDTIIGLALGVWIIYSGAKLSMESNAELMDSFDNQSVIYEKVFEIVDKTIGAYNPHKLRIRKIHNFVDIDLDIEVDGNLSVREGHAIATSIQDKIKQEFKTVYDVLIHVEPCGNVEKEQFGLSPKDF